MRRVVITGLGLVTPLGVGAEANWGALRAGRSGIGPITHFDASRLPWRIAGEVRDFDVAKWVDTRERRRMDRFICFAIAAAAEAIQTAGIVITDEIADRVGVVVGVGLGGLPLIEEGLAGLATIGYRRMSPFFIPAVIGNLAASHVAMRAGARGLALTTTSACASGAHAIGEAFEMIRSGRLDVAIAGGTEAVITASAVSGFGVMHALASWDGHPEGASRPFDARRSGFVLAEGAGMLVLEGEEIARGRGASAFAELAGYGASGDAFHITQPPDDGAGAQRAMHLALARAGCAPDDVDHVNAHATATRQGDIAEIRALHAVFGRHASRLAISATKSMTGHLLGAAGAVEAAYTILAIREQTAPPTINLDDPDRDCNLDCVPHHARPMRIRAAMSNSFGFGGTNAALLFTVRQ